MVVLSQSEAMVGFVFHSFRALLDLCQAFKELLLVRRLLEYRLKKLPCSNCEW